jgi:hypothetical protein
LPPPLDEHRSGGVGSEAVLPLALVEPRSGGEVDEAA